MVTVAKTVKNDNVYYRLTLRSFTHSEILLVSTTPTKSNIYTLCFLLSNFIIGNKRLHSDNKGEKENKGIEITEKK